MRSKSNKKSRSKIRRRSKSNRKIKHRFGNTEDEITYILHVYLKNNKFSKNCIEDLLNKAQCFIFNENNDMNKCLEYIDHDLCKKNKINKRNNQENDNELNTFKLTSCTKCPSYNLANFINLMKIIKKIINTPYDIKSCIKDIISYKNFDRNANDISKDDKYLQADEIQVELLKLLKKLNNWDNSVSNWIDLFSLKFNKHYTNIENYVMFDIRSKVEIIDLIKRSNEIANNIQSNENINKLIILDGHGRTLSTIMYFLQNYYNANENRDLIIEIYDIDYFNHVWHELFFPSNVENIGNYKIKIINKKSDILNINLINNKNTLVYFNFCGIGSMFKEIETLFNKLHDIEQYQFYFSLANIMGARNITKKFNEMIKYEYDYTLITKREDFKTYYFFKHKVLDFI